MRITVAVVSEPAANPRRPSDTHSFSLSPCCIQEPCRRVGRLAKTNPVNLYEVYGVLWSESTDQHVRPRLVGPLRAALEPFVNRVRDNAVQV